MPNLKKVSFSIDLGKVDTSAFYQGEKALYASFTGKSTPKSPYNPFMLTQYLGTGHTDHPKVGNGKHRGEGDPCEADFKLKVKWDKLDMDAAYEYNGRKYVTLDAVFRSGEYSDGMVVQYLGKNAEEGPIVGDVNFFEAKSDGGGMSLPSGMGDEDGMPF